MASIPACCYAFDGGPSLEGNINPANTVWGYHLAPWPPATTRDGESGGRSGIWVRLLHIIQASNRASLLSLLFWAAGLETTNTGTVGQEDKGHPLISINN